MGKLLTPKNDYVFKKLFAKNTEILTDLINSVLRLPRNRRIRSATVRNPEILPSDITKKFIILDIHAVDDSGGEYDIEMQVRKYDTYPERALYYLCKMYSDKLKSGEDYGKPNPVIGIKTGHAYKCFCSKEEIERKREAAVKAKQTYQYDRTCRGLSEEEIAKKESLGLRRALRLKIPDGDGSVIFDDAVYGRIEKKYKDLEDFIIVRSNGKPLYVLSNAVDDIRDKVTHIIRGQDGLANTPKQVLLYDALKAPLPVFAHMSLTLDPKKAKISKRRHGEMVAVH